MENRRLQALRGDSLDCELHTSCIMSDEENGEAGVADRLRKWNRVDDVDRLRLRVTRALRVAEAVMYADDAEHEERLKAVHAVVSAAREARQLADEAEVQEKVEQLERLTESLTNGHGAA